MLKEEFKKTKYRVYKILINHELSRESDKVLWIEYMKQFHNMEKVLNDKQWSGRAVVALSKLFLSDDVPSFETLSRARRKIQEQYESLRGDNYGERIRRSFDVTKYIKEF